MVGLILVFFLGNFATMVCFAGIGYTRNEMEFVQVSSTLVGLLSAVSMQAVRFYLELRRLRAMKDFFWGWFAGEKQKLQSVVNEALAYHAGAVKAHSESLIRLQQDGLRAEENPNCDATDEEGLGKTFDYVRSRLMRDFRRSQARFYCAYDQIKLFAGMLRVKVRDRSWKAYVGEPEVDAK